MTMRVRVRDLRRVIRESIDHFEMGVTKDTGMLDHPATKNDIPLGYAPDEVDSGEGSMAKSQLEQICYMSRELLDAIEREDELPDWVQAKLATVKDRLQSVHGFLIFSDDPRVEVPEEHM